MQVTVYPPSARLAPFVRRFTIVETRDEATRALLPEHGLVLGIRFAGAAHQVDGDTAIRLADASLTGMLATARQVRTAAGSGVVLAMFHETGAARFLAGPLHELSGRTRALDDLMPRRDVARVQQGIADAADHRRRIARLEQFLLSRLRPEPTDPLAAAAVAEIQRAHGALRIAALARELGISRDPLEKRFRAAIGTSPKQLASLIRLSHVVDAQRRARRAGGPDRAPGWSRLAVEAGYFDQSHFIREFRAVTGAPPGRFFRAVEHC